MIEAFILYDDILFDKYSFDRARKDHASFDDFAAYGTLADFRGLGEGEAYLRMKDRFADSYDLIDERTIMDKVELYEKYAGESAGPSMSYYRPNIFDPGPEDRADRDMMAELVLSLGYEPLTYHPLRL